MKCPTCGAETYGSVGGAENCPECGHGAPAATPQKEEQRQEDGEFRRPVLERPADTKYRSGPWELRILYRARGTRSEGSHGVLYRNGEIVEPHHLGEFVDTGLGKLKYYAHLEEPHLPWATTGWHFADRSLILPSSAKEDKTA